MYVQRKSMCLVSSTFVFGYHKICMPSILHMLLFHGLFFFFLLFLQTQFDSLLRCPASQSRYGDGSACRGGGLPNCDLGFCHNNPNGGMESCVQPTPWFRVDLGASYDIHQIVIHAPSLLSLPKFLIYFGDASGSPSSSSNLKCGSSYESYMSLTAGQSVTLNCRGVGRYAFLWSGLTSPMSVAEFHVLGTIAGGYYYDGFGLSGQVRECPAGYYCGGGSKVPCPPGRYGSSKKNMCSTCDGPCLGGYHCGAGSTNEASEACAPSGAAFPEEFYCLKGLPRQGKKGKNLKGIRIFFRILANNLLTILSLPTYLPTTYLVSSLQPFQAVIIHSQKTRIQSTRRALHYVLTMALFVPKEKEQMISTLSRVKMDRKDL